MALLKGVPMRFCGYSNQNNSQLGFGEFGNGHSFLNLKSDKKWSCWGLLVSQKQQETTHLEDDKSSLPSPVDTCGPAGVSAEPQISQLPRADFLNACDILSTLSTLIDHRECNRTGDQLIALLTRMDQFKWKWHVGGWKTSEPLTAAAFSPSKDGSTEKVAYQGVPGAYSEAAALKAYPKCETVPCDQFEAAFKAVELWLVDKAVLPIENSVGGSIHRNYDLLLRHRLHIVGEVQLVVNHCLMTLPGVRAEELKRVLSHPQALSQCEMTLNKYGLVRVSADDTAGAAQMVASQGVKDTGAVASARAAELYGLDILAANIQDDSDNITRFLILAREPIIPGTHKPHKTSIVFSLAEGPGVLFKALAVFALREINLTKVRDSIYEVLQFLLFVSNEKIMQIESRPQLKRPLRVVDDSNKGSAKLVFTS
ncbi:dehydratase [Lithospermum erythrorhizon]|uniref:arogenate dehydratase n=1 Tax=Lithospermum erythrorhizon TaxID=34254 RepID=A0AAV3P580_LITER